VIRRSILLPIALLFLLSASLSRAEWPPSFSGELGVLGASGADAQPSKRARSYVEPSVQWKTSEDGFGLNLRLSARAWQQLTETSGSSSSQSQLEIRDSYVGYDTESTRVRLGFQSISWGETFGFFVADLPNPRDLTDPLLLEIGHIKKPLFMLQGQSFFSGGGIQAFFAPVARHTELPLAIPRREFTDVGRDSEYGVRINRLLSFGLDGSVFALRHHERGAVLDPQAIWSVGATASQSFGNDWVLRTDQVFTDLRQSTLDAWRGVFGLDWNGLENITLAGQAQRDPLNTGASLRFTARGRSGFWDGAEFEVFWFHGIEVTENWIQPKITYTTKSNLSVSLRYDWLDGSVIDPGLLRGLLREDRGLLWLTYGF